MKQVASPLELPEAVAPGAGLQLLPGAQQSAEHKACKHNCAMNSTATYVAQLTITNRKSSCAFMLGP